MVILYANYLKFVFYICFFNDQDTRESKWTTEIFIKAKLIPSVIAPKWMISAWFPDGPADMLGRFKSLVETL